MACAVICSRPTVPMARSWLWQTADSKSLEMALTLPQGCPCHKWAGAVYLKIARVYLLLKSSSLSKNKLKCLLFHEAFSKVLFFLPTPLHSNLPTHHSALSQLARYSIVLDHDTPESRERGTKNVAVEQPQKMEPSPSESWTSYAAELAFKSGKECCPCRCLWALNGKMCSECLHRSLEQNGRSTYVRDSPHHLHSLESPMQCLAHTECSINTTAGLK